MILIGYIIEVLIDVTHAFKVTEDRERKGDSPSERIHLNNIPNRDNLRKESQEANGLDKNLRPNHH